MRYLIETSTDATVDKSNLVAGYCEESGQPSKDEAASAIRLTKDSKVNFPTKDAFPGKFLRLEIFIVLFALAAAHRVS